MDGFVTVNQGSARPADAGAARQALYDGARVDGLVRPDRPARSTTSWRAPSRWRTTTTARRPGRRSRTATYLIAARASGATYNTFPDLTNYPFPHERRGRSSTSSRSVTRPGCSTRTALRARARSTEPRGATRWGRSVDRALRAVSQRREQRASCRRSPSSIPTWTPSRKAAAGTDEHPPGDIQSGELFVSQVVQAVTTSPQWSHLALFITHDENGGFYDHVPPPPACAPDSIAPILQNGDHDRRRLRRATASACSSSPSARTPRRPTWATPSTTTRASRDSSRRSSRSRRSPRATPTRRRRWTCSTSPIPRPSRPRRPFPRRRSTRPQLSYCESTYP